MVEKNSGKIYLVPLDFNLGYAICKVDDYTDIAPFDGLLVSVFKKRLDETEKIPSISDIYKFDILFGPLPLNKYPNIKGKGAWKYVGKSIKIDDLFPVFKGTDERVALYKAVDWSTVKKWYMIDLNDNEEYTDYEKIRGLEMRILYDMRSVEIRTTMHFLLLSNKKVEEYFDLKVEMNRNLYLHLINTSFDEKNAIKYLQCVKNMKIY